MNETPVVIGSLNSTELSKSQLKLATMIEYFAKVSAHVSAEPITIKIEQPEGLRRFLEEKAKLEKTQKRSITKDEIEKLEREVRYDIRNVAIGNSQVILGRLLTDAFQSNKVRKVLDLSIDDAVEVAEKAVIMINAQKTKSDSDLI